MPLNKMNKPCEIQNIFSKTHKEYVPHNKIKLNKVYRIGDLKENEARHTGFENELRLLGKKLHSPIFFVPTWQGPALGTYGYCVYRTQAGTYKIVETDGLQGFFYLSIKQGARNLSYKKDRQDRHAILQCVKEYQLLRENNEPELLDFS